MTIRPNPPLERTVRLAESTDVAPLASARVTFTITDAYGRQRRVIGRPEHLWHMRAGCHSTDRGVGCLIAVEPAGAIRGYRTALLLPYGTEISFVIPATGHAGGSELI